MWPGLRIGGALCADRCPAVVGAISVTFSVEHEFATAAGSRGAAEQQRSVIEVRLKGLQETNLKR